MRFLTSKQHTDMMNGNNNCLNLSYKTHIGMKKGVPSAESSRSVQGLGKGVSGKPYSRLCNARRPRLEPGTFWSQAVRLYRLHQARPSKVVTRVRMQKAVANLSQPKAYQSGHVFQEQEQI